MEETDRAAVAALLAPVTVESFLHDHWPERSLHVHGAPERLPHFLQQPVLSSAEQLFAHYRGRILFGKGTSGPRSFMMQQVAPSHLYRMGLSLYLPDVEPMLPQAAEFLRSLERVCGVDAGCARITAWASPSEEGIACHYDPEDVFSIQLQGEKSFFVAPQAAMQYPTGTQFGPGHPPDKEHFLQCGAGFPSPDDAVFEEILMKPGSLLFIPRGHWHRTYATKNSLSVSIVLAPQILAERVLQELRSLMLQDPHWRRPIYGDPNTSITTLAGLQTLCSRISFQHLLAKTPTISGLQYRTEDRFQKMPDWNASYTVESEFIRLRIDPPADGDEYSGFFEAQVPGECAAVVDWLKRRSAAFTVAQLQQGCAEVAAESLDELLAYLVSVQYLRALWFRPL